MQGRTMYDMDVFDLSVGSPQKQAEVQEAESSVDDEPESANLRMS
jgi:hypothetical protein